MRATLLFLAIAVTGCGTFFKGIPGSGVIKQETREVSSFTKIAFAGGADITITSGADEPGCMLECDDNLLPLIRTEVVGDELRIGFKEGSSSISPTKGLKVEIKTPGLTHVQLAGGTTTTITGVAGESIEFDLAGSHTLETEGEADKVRIHSAGSVDVQAANLKAKVMSIESAGNCTADVDVSEALTVDSAGRGDVSYSGSAKVTQRIAGAGTVKKKE